MEGEESEGVESGIEEDENEDHEFDDPEGYVDDITDEGTVVYVYVCVGRSLIH